MRRERTVMEIAIAVFIGLWISTSAWVAYRHLKKEYGHRMGKGDR